MDNIKVKLSILERNKEVFAVNKLSLGERMGTDSPTAAYGCPLFDS